MTAAVQTLWAELIAASLADCGVTVCAISPGSRSTPLVAALAREPRLALVTIIDERAAAFYALGAARATGVPAALVCTSGTAAAHYLPAVIEASLSAVPLIVLTADRPPELHECGASQTIEQVGLYGGFTRAAFDLGAPAGTALAFRALRRKLVQSVTIARGPYAGPVHLNVALAKPLEPARPAGDEEVALARAAHELRGTAIVAPPVLAADREGLGKLAAVLAAEPHGVIVAGALPVAFGSARSAVLALAGRLGYPIIAEAGSQLRFGPRDPSVLCHTDLVPIDQRPPPRVIVQLGAEPVAASWPAWLRGLDCQRWVLAGGSWHDADSSATGVIMGDVATAIAALDITLQQARQDVAQASAPARPDAPHPRAPGHASNEPQASWAGRWRELDARAAAAIEQALDPSGEPAVIRAAIAAVPEGVAIQLGNSLPIRVVDQVCTGAAHPVITQRGAAGIDGMIAAAAGATHAGPVLLVLGDVSFAHDLGGLLAARCAIEPLAILVIDNGGGRIFDELPIARADLGAVFERHFVTAPGIDPVRVATALGIRAVAATSPAAVATAVRAALGLGTDAANRVTVIHAPVAPAGAREFRQRAGEHP